MKHQDPDFFILSKQNLIDLENHGYLVIESVLSNEFGQTILDWGQGLLDHGYLKSARIGHSKIANQTIRGDWHYWIDSFPEQLSPLQNLIYSVMGSLKVYFRVSLKCEEQQLTFYPAGTGYQKHWDNSNNSNSRLFTFILYLNSNWLPTDKGELVLFPDEKNSLLDLKIILPKNGTLVLFKSSTIPHEVNTTNRTRWAISGWFK